MNILVLTTTHPLDVAEAINELYNTFDEHNNLYSVQAFALLSEETFDKHYIPTMYTFAAEVRRNPKLIYNHIHSRENTIVFGNLDKDTKIKFDHVVAVSPSLIRETETFDQYLKNISPAMDEVFTNKKIKPINWYTTEDCEHVFPTYHHLFTFLNVIGVKSNELQSQPTECN